MIDIITTGPESGQALRLELSDEGQMPTLMVPVDSFDVLHRSGSTITEAMDRCLMDAATSADARLLAEILYRAYASDSHTTSIELHPDDARALAAVLVHLADESERKWGRR